MREVAQWPDKDRQDLFQETANEMGAPPAIAEKDFWVCWMLDYLFHDSAWKGHLVFKGGTSLSKAYNAIERFSEDIDLVLDWTILGYTKDQPWEARKTTQQDAFGKAANQKAIDFIQGKMAPALRADLPSRVTGAIEIRADGENILIDYPKSFDLKAVQPQIRLEIGPMAEWLPNAGTEIRPYAAEKFPEQFNQPVTTVRTIEAERTFWEKATILHQEAHRATGKPLPPRYSRHYYDLYRMSASPFAIGLLSASICSKRL